MTATFTSPRKMRCVRFPWPASSICTLRLFTVVDSPGHPLTTRDLCQSTFSAITLSSVAPNTVPSGAPSECILGAALSRHSWRAPESCNRGHCQWSSLAAVSIMQYPRVATTLTRWHENETEWPRLNDPPRHPWLPLGSITKCSWRFVLLVMSRTASTRSHVASQKFPRVRSRQG